MRFYKLNGRIVLLLLVLVLGACGGAAETPTPTSTPAAPAVETPTTGANVGAAITGLRTFVVVPAESKASYLVDEEFFGGAFEKYGIAAGAADVIGATQAIEGQLQLNLDNLAEALGENRFTVQMNTFTTEQSRRDNWIRDNGPSFNRFPVATFVASAVEGAPTSYSEGTEVSFQLVGDLTIREVTQPTTFAVTAQITGDTLTGVATTRLKMSNFGIDPPNFANTLTVADEFGIEVQITAREQ
jgi:polyisoprenoid-binding protein YceI